MDPASSERSRFREAMADVPRKPSRGHCGNGFLHRPNAHVWCSVLLFRHRHDRRKILHFNVTRNPHALWVVQQLRLCRMTAPLQHPEPFRTPVIRHSLAPVEDRNTDQNRDEILQGHASTQRS